MPRLFLFELNFSFSSRLDLTGGSGEVATDGAFGSFFFGNGESPINKDHPQDGKSN